LMLRMWYRTYNCIILPLLWIVLQALGLVQAKTRRGIRGRKGLFERLRDEVPKLAKRHRIWFHSSSMGEFEQAKPIIAALRKRYDDIAIIVSFFSPSGYEHSRAYKLADLITYIPFDKASNAARFLDLVKPTVAVMVRYDVWPNHVWELHRRRIPIFIANATLRPTSKRLLWPIRIFHAQLYELVTAILTVSDVDRSTFQRFQLKSPEIRTIGDTRYDQVWQRCEEARSKHLIPPELLKRKHVFLVGSSWEEDEDIVIPGFRKVARHDPQALMILVPHEPTVETLERLELELGSHNLRSIRFSELNDYSNENVILVDSIGILMTLYQYAGVAFVGGSFRQGVHNVLEPAVYGIPVLYGPRHENSHEAKELARRKGGFVVSSIDECYKTLRTLLNDRHARTTAGKQSLALVRENIGATDRVIEYLSKVL
ncbi:MAG: glycosyltransferase N-terminal domain-containing protein, partial [Bacteroidota bacterium]